MSYYNENAARSKAQLKNMQDLVKKGICIFCPEYIREDKHKLELETTHWMVKRNSYPYKNTRLHLLVIPKAHVRVLSDLSKGAQQEFLAVVSRLEEKFKLKSYAVGFRAGDFRYNASSIEHLHAHLVVGDTDNPNHKPVRFKMSSRTD